MNRILLIAGREYFDNARTKGFLFSLLIVPLLLVMATQVPILLQEKAAPTRLLVVVDPDERFSPSIRDAIAEQEASRVRAAWRAYYAKRAAPDAPPEGAGALDSWLPGVDAQALIEPWRPELSRDAPDFEIPRPRFQWRAAPSSLPDPRSTDAVAEALKPYLQGDQRHPDGGQLFAAIVVPPSTSEAPIQFWSRNVADDELANRIRAVVNQRARNQALLDAGIQPDVAQQAMSATTPIVELDPSKRAGQEQVSERDRIAQWAPSAFVYLLWISLFSTMQLLLNSTIEEKSNRLVELLLSSVSVRELMVGKLLGSALTGGTMVAVWVGSLVLLMGSVARGPTAELAGQFVDVVGTTALLPAFFLYFLLGYLTLAGLFLAVGGMCNTVKESQNYVGLMTMILMVPLLTMTFIPKDPHGPIAQFMSWFPLYTPFAMLNRIVANPPIWQIVATTCWSFVTIGILFTLAERVFKASILRTSGPPKWSEFWKALRAPRDE